MAVITYMKAGETPGWTRARVINIDTGELMTKVLEIDTCEGCLLRQARHPSGRPVIMAGSYQNELILGNFRIELDD